MESLLTKFGISDLDLLLLLLCPMLGALGSIFGVAAKYHSLIDNSRVERQIKLPNIETSGINLIAERLQNSVDQLYSSCNQKAIDNAMRVMMESISAIRSCQAEINKINQYLNFWNHKPKIFLRILLGFGLGLAIALYFLGTVQANLTFITRLGLACFLLGYQAPKVWLLQENIIASAIEKRMLTLLQDRDGRTKQQ